MDEARASTVRLCVDQLGQNQRGLPLNGGRRSPGGRRNADGAGHSLRFPAFAETDFPPITHTFKHKLQVKAAARASGELNHVPSDDLDTGGTSRPWPPPARFTRFRTSGLPPQTLSLFQ